MTRSSLLRAAAITTMVAALSVGAAQPVWAQADETFTVSGVAYLDDAPLAGAQVCDYIGACTTTAADGSYTVAVKTATSPGYTTPCLALRPGNAEQRELFAPVGLSSHGGVCILPVQGAAGEVITGKTIGTSSFALVSGQVVDQAGKPIKGATVDSQVPTKHLTDAQGRFSVRVGKFSYDGEHLFISAAGYADAKTYWVGSGNLGRIVLAKAGNTQAYSISGRVMDAAGKPAVGAKVCEVGGACFRKTDATGAYYGLLPGWDTTVRFWDLTITTADGRIKAPVRVQSGMGNFSTKVDFQLPGIVGAKPKIVGEPKVGTRLTVQRGTWGPKPVKIKVQWYANGKAVRGATSTGLKLTKKLVGKVITVKVTGTKAGYPRVVKVSDATVKVHR